MNRNNSGLQQINSFLTNNLKYANNAISNTVTNTINNSKDVFKNSANIIKNSANTINNTIKNSTQSISEPISESINATINSSSAPVISVGVVVALGALIVSFIIVVMFRDQIMNGFELFYNKMRDILGLSTPSPVAPSPPSMTSDISVDGSVVDKILPGKKEVFNISQDKYTFSDAEPVCKALGAELATYEQVKEAWSKGADWCNYGWVKGQAAVYPTQQTTYDKLQQGPDDQKMACGVTGINGGYFDNPELRFGVNCFGVKPSENEHDIKNIMSQDNLPLTPDVIEYDKKVADFRAHQNEIAINPFKDGTWSS
jgi:hypothetical protein